MSDYDRDAIEQELDDMQFHIFELIVLLNHIYEYEPISKSTKQLIEYVKRNLNNDEDE